MGKRRDGSKDKLASGLLRGAVVSGLVSGLAAASLGGVGTANATCLSIGGFFSIGSGCTSSPLSFAVVLGTGTANARRAPHRRLCDRQRHVRGRPRIPHRSHCERPGQYHARSVPPQTDVRSAGALSLAYGGGTNTLVRTEGNLSYRRGARRWLYRTSGRNAH